MLIYSFGNNIDDEKVGYDIFSSYVILGKILNRHSERLKDECTSGRMLVHKLSDDAGISYLLIDKSGDNSQILVRFGYRKELLDVCLEGSRNDGYGLEHYVWKINIAQNSKGSVRISGIELHGNMIATGKPKDVLVSEINDSPLTKADWKELKMAFVR